MFKYFTAPNMAGDQWFSVGLASSFPDLGQDEEEVGVLSQPRPCGGGNGKRPGCKAFHVPKLDSSKSQEVPIIPSASDDRTTEQQTTSDIGGGIVNESESLPLEEQVLVFQYKRKFHAVDHSCPHSSFPLSKGIPFDIEDFGVILSAGISCPKHGWSFDLFTGMSDRGNYKLKIWEVQLRDIAGAKKAENGDIEDKEVWVRRRQRMG
ncbi:hypothetical protein V8F33_003565 [Rhypophila sp. PSN 637]